MQPHDQAEQLRELSRQRRSGLTLSILSGKGGVGKSNIAVNLSVCLAERGLKVTLVDLDIGLANADLLMNLHPRHTLAHVVAGVRSIEEIVLPGPGGLQFVPGASGMHRLSSLSEFERQHLLSQLHKLRSSADMVVFDLGAGLSRNVLAFAHESDQCWVVTTPEPTAFTDAYTTIKAMSRENPAARVSLVVNRADSRAEAEAVHARLSSVAKKFLNYPVANAGYLLHDTSVELAVAARCPFVIRDPGSNASACIAAMASELALRFSTPAKRAGLWRRVAGLFV